MDAQANIEFVRQFYDAYLKGDRERLMSYMAPDIEWDVPAMPDIAFSGRRRGREQVAEFFRLVKESQTLARFEPREFIAQGEQVVVLGHHDWTVNATGVKFSTDWVQIFTIRDQQVTVFRHFFDTNTVVNAYHSDAPGARDSLPSAQCPSLH